MLRTFSVIVLSRDDRTKIKPPGRYSSFPHDKNQFLPHQYQLNPTRLPSTAKYTSLGTATVVEMPKRAADAAGAFKSI
jgi:hypothetical protein